METKKPPLWILPESVSKTLGKPWKGFGYVLAKRFPQIEQWLSKTPLSVNAPTYILFSLCNALFIFFCSFAIFFFLRYYQLHQSVIASVVIAFLVALFFSFLVLVVLFYYPKILAGKKAEQIDKSLTFALKDLLLQIHAGVPLYDALVNIAKAKYGLVSEEFARVVKSINSGKSIAEALEDLALTSESEFLRRTIWQLVNTMKAGASLQGALHSVIDGLTSNQRSSIKSYAQELNLWSLLYLLFAVAVPTIGTTLLIILSSFAGFGVTPVFFLMFIGLTFVIQIILIGFVKTRRPIITW
ncbi:type II secretion system F family protein [Candidatus Woesearchaeota archaeon]|nr:type II secretion system F family protein [Candidatus Woesearchaeota archaeon]